MIVLLDLNYTLVANSKDLSGKPLEFRKKNEHYREWLIAILKQMAPEAVVMLTVRTVEWEQWTLARIKQLTGWQPDHAVFNYTRDGSIRPEQFKEQALHEVIFPRYGNPAGQYLGVESNLDTWKVYAKYGITGLKAFPSYEAPGVAYEPADRRLFS